MQENTLYETICPWCTREKGVEEIVCTHCLNELIPLHKEAYFNFLLGSGAPMGLFTTIEDEIYDNPNEFVLFVHYVAIAAALK